MVTKKLFSFIAAVLVMTMASCNGPVSPSSSDSSGNTDTSETEHGSESSNTDESSEPGQEDKYQVSEAYWNENITQGKYFEKNPNFTVEGVSIYGNERDVISIEYDNGNFHAKTGGDEVYFEVSKDGKFYLYSYNATEAKWFKIEYPELIDYALELKAFLVPVPFSILVYNSSTHAYELNSLYVTEELSELTFRFENNKIIRITLKGTSVGEDGSTIYAESDIEFKNYGTTTVTFPEAGTPGGEEQPKERFVNKELMVSGMSSEYPDYSSLTNRWENATFSLFSDGSLEIIQPNRETGTVIGYLGQYTSNQEKATLLLKRLYDSSNTEKPYTDLRDETLEINYDKTEDEYYIIETFNGYEVYYYLFDTESEPSHYAFPGSEDDSARYKVTEEVFNNLTSPISYFEGKRICVIKYMDNTEITRMKIDNGKIHVKNTDLNTEQYFEYKGNGKYDSYYFNTTDKVWVKSENVSLPNDFFDPYFNGGMNIPYNQLTFNSISKCYYAAEYKQYWDDVNYAYFSQVNFAFCDNLLGDISYHYLYSDYSFHFIYGNIQVELPEVNQPVEPVDYREMLHDKVFDFASITVPSSAGASDDQINLIKGMHKDSTITFFEDNTAEVVLHHSISGNGTLNDLDNVIIGTYEVQKKNDYYLIQINITFFVSQGKQAENEEDSLLLRYYDKNNSIVVPLNEVGNFDGPRATYTLGEKTPTHYEYVPPVEPPASVWPAEDIATALKKLEINEVLPELAGAASVNIIEAADNTSVIVKCEFGDDTSALAALYVYASELLDESGKYGFTLINYDSDNIIVKLQSKQGEFILTISSSTKYVLLTVEPNNKIDYPAEDIAAYIEEQGYTDVLPSLIVETKANYSFQVEYATIVINLVDRTKYNDSLSQIVTILGNSKFSAKRIYTDDGIVELYVSLNNQYGLFITGNADVGLIYVMIVDASELSYLTNVYPETSINATIPSYIHDELPSFEVRGAEYLFNEADDGFSLFIAINNPQVALRTISTNLAGAGFTLAEENVYSNETETIQITVETYENGVLVVVMYSIHECEYIFRCNQDWIMNDDVVIYAWVWGGQYGEGENAGTWVEVSVEEIDLSAEGGFGVAYKLTLYVNSDANGCILVRFAPDVEPSWANEGRFNQTNDINLSHKVTDSMTITFNS